MPKIHLVAPTNTEVNMLEDRLQQGFLVFESRSNRFVMVSSIYGALQYDDETPLRERLRANSENL